jgi:hypothetical protein
MSQSSEFYCHNPLCCFSTSVYCCLRIFRYRFSPETLLGMLISSCIRGLGPFWRNSYAQHAMLIGFSFKKSQYIMKTRLRQNVSTVLTGRSFSLCTRSRIFCHENCKFITDTTEFQTGPYPGPVQSISHYIDLILSSNSCLISQIQLFQ